MAMKLKDLPMSMQPDEASVAAGVRVERMAAIRDAWISIGLSRAPADRARAEAAVRLTYRRAGLPDTVRIVWAASPMSGAVIARSLVRGSTKSRVSIDIAGPAACRLWAMIQHLRST